MFLVSFGNTFVHSLRSMMTIGTFIRSVDSECLSPGPQRKHVRKGDEQQSVCVSVMQVTCPRPPCTSLQPTSCPPPSSTSSLFPLPLATSFPQSLAAHSLHHPRFSHNSPPTRITPLIQNQTPASKKTSSLTPTSPTDLTSWKCLLVISQNSPASSSCLPWPLLVMRGWPSPDTGLLSVDRHAQWKVFRSSGQGRLAAGLHRGLARALSSRLLSSSPTLTTQTFQNSSPY